MRGLTIGFAALLLTPSLLYAQAPSWEIGTRLGITRLWRASGGDTFFRLPGGGIAGEPSLHAAYFIPHDGGSAGPTTFLEAEVQLWAGLDAAGGSVVGLGVQVGYLPGGAAARSLYGAISGALLTGAGSTILAPGVAAGYRVPVTPHFAVRFQANYRRWIDPEENEFSVVLILALVGG